MGGGCARGAAATPRPMNRVRRPVIDRAASSCEAPTRRDAFAVVANSPGAFVAALSTDPSGGFKRLCPTRTHLPTQTRKQVNTWLG